MMRNNNHNSGSEIYIRADGKKVRRVRRTTNNESLPSLGGFLQQGGGSKLSKLSGSATVVGDRKLDGEIIIQADGKKKIRRVKNKTEATNSAASSSGDLPVPMVGEIFLNAEGKRVRRVKRSPSTTIISSPQSTADCANVSPDLSKSLLNATTTGKPIVHLTDKEEAIATEYRKLKNMGLPDDAVWHKMTVSDVQPNIIAAVMGKEWNEPVAIGTLSQPRLLSSSSSAFGTTTTSTTLSSIQLTNDEEAVASVNRKMQKKGLPEDAVRHKMIVNDVAPKVVAAVLGEEWKEQRSSSAKTTLSIDSHTDMAKSPHSSQIALTSGEEAIAAVYRKLQKMDISDDAIRHKMMASDIHPKIIAAVLGDEWTEEPTKEEQNLISVAVTKALILTSEEEEVAAPFRKLTNIGCPRILFDIK
jgi:hypothetical protein